LAIGLGAFQEGVGTLLELDGVLTHAVGQPMVLIEADAGGEWKVRADAHENPSSVPITQLILLNSIANRRRTVSPCVAAGRLFTVTTVIRGFSYAWWWGYPELVSPRPLHLHRISSVGRTLTRWNGSYPRCTRSYGHPPLLFS
jgi:hypothetical protein